MMDIQTGQYRDGSWWARCGKYAATRASEAEAVRVVQSLYATGGRYAYGGTRLP
jgi:hypothetical protein